LPRALSWRRRRNLVEEEKEIKKFNCCFLTLLNIFASQVVADVSAIRRRAVTVPLAAWIKERIAVPIVAFPPQNIIGFVAFFSWLTWVYYIRSTHVYKIFLNTPFNLDFFRLENLTQHLQQKCYNHFSIHFLNISHPLCLSVLMLFYVISFLRIPLVRYTFATKTITGIISYIIHCAVINIVRKFRDKKSTDFFV
jgi:hypothetical protein